MNGAGKPINVLVFPCGSEIGLEIHAALRHAKDIRLHGTSSVDDHGGFAYRRYRRIDATAPSMPGPSAEAAGLVSALNALIEEWQIDLVLPAHDSAVLALAEAAATLAAPAAVPNPRTALDCRDKRLTYTRLRHLGITPDDAAAPGAGYPIFAKPAIGQGSQGAERVDTEARHRELLDCGVPYVFSEFLPGEEYTVDCVSDRDGRLLHAAPRLRTRVRQGISVRTAPAPADPVLEAMASAIAAELGLKGAWFFQARRNSDGQPRLLEVAPRPAGSMAMSRMRGINYPLLHVYAHLGREFAVLPQVHPVVMDRALGNRYRIDLEYRRVYLDLDDTLIVRGAVHPQLAALLYQWAAAAIEVVLITRHAATPLDTLHRHHLSAGLFSRIVHLQDGSPKSAAIEPGVPAIFIDDSFRERRDVHRNAGIPVFDLDAVEQLLDRTA